MRKTTSRFIHWNLEVKSRRRKLLLFILMIIILFWLSGRVGAALDIRYEEVFRDPDDASPEKKSVFTFGMVSLLPGASYYFRLRALNGYGSRYYTIQNAQSNSQFCLYYCSEFTYKIFTTLTAAPMHPLATKISSHSVTLTWLFTKKFVNRFLAIKSLFDAAKNENNGKF